MGRGRSLQFCKQRFRVRIHEFACVQARYSRGETDVGASQVIHNKKREERRDGGKHGGTREEAGREEGGMEEGSKGGEEGEARERERERRREGRKALCKTLPFRPLGHQSRNKSEIEPWALNQSTQTISLVFQRK